MEMEVWHRLARLGAAVGHHPEIGDAQLLRHLGDNLEAVLHHQGIASSPQEPMWTLGITRKWTGAWGAMS